MSIYKSTQPVNARVDDYLEEFQMLLRALDRPSGTRSWMWSPSRLRRYLLTFTSPPDYTVRRPDPFVDKIDQYDDLAIETKTETDHGAS